MEGENTEDFITGLLTAYQKSLISARKGITRCCSSALDNRMENI